MCLRPRQPGRVERAGPGLARWCDCAPHSLLVQYRACPATSCCGRGWYARLLFVVFPRPQQGADHCLFRGDARSLGLLDHAVARAGRPKGVRPLFSSIAATWPTARRMSGLAHPRLPRLTARLAGCSLACASCRRKRACRSDRQCGRLTNLWDGEFPPLKRNSRRVR